MGIFASFPEFPQITFKLLLSKNLFDFYLIKISLDFLRLTPIFMLEVGHTVGKIGL